LVLFDPVETGDDLLGRFLTGVDHVLGLLEAFIEGSDNTGCRIPILLEHRQHPALREAEVQQPMTAAHLSLTNSFFAFSAKVGQSLAPSS